jgi:FAD synthase
VEVRFVRYLRSEKKFENIESLQDQIGRDVAQVRAIFAT